METGHDQPAAAENPDEYSSDEHNQLHGGGGGAIRSYECTFCKRGFSNAQALGGHMNIHRRDKAKLKQTTETTSTTTTTQQSNLVQDIPKVIIPSYSPNQAGKWPWVIKDDDDDDQKRDETSSCHVGSDNIRKLPLFDEKPSLTTDQINPSSTGTDDIEKGQLGSSGSDQLDLELRLGPHQPTRYHSSSPTMTTKKFF